VGWGLTTAPIHSPVCALEATTGVSQLPFQNSSGISISEPRAAIARFGSNSTHLIITRSARACALGSSRRQQKQEPQSEQDDGAPDHEHLLDPFAAGTSFFDYILHARKVDRRKLKVHRDVAIGLRRISVRFPGRVNWSTNFEPANGLQTRRFLLCEPLAARSLAFIRSSIPVNIRIASPDNRDTLKRLTERGFWVADTKKIEDKLERKKVKRTARKKAAPKAKRTVPRGSNKKKVKKLTRGQSKR
jgi:hypothetical protein